MVDANMHLRHLSYADFAAQARLELLEHVGFTAAKFKEYHIGPILFREELVYLKEVPPNEDITMNCVLSKWNESKSFWSFTQELYRADGVKPHSYTLMAHGSILPNVNWQYYLRN